MRRLVLKVLVLSFFILTHYPLEIVALLLLLLSSIHTHGGFFGVVGSEYMQTQWAYGLMALSFFLIRRVVAKTDYLCGLVFAYILFSSIPSAFLLPERLMKLGPELAQNAGILIAFALLASTLCVWAFIEMDKRWVTALRRIVPIYTVINALYVILVWWTGNRFKNGTGVHGFLDYSGMNGVLLCLGLPFLFINYKDEKAARYCKVFGLIVTCISILLSNSAVSCGVMAVVFVTRLLNPIWGLFPLGIGALVLGQKMLDSSGRFQAYKVFLTDHFNNGFLWWGTGFGSFRSLEILTQQKTGFNLDMATGQGWLWPWLHSDVLQAGVYEGGIVFGVLILLLYFRAMRQVFQKGDLEAFSLGASVFASSLLDYPLRYMPTCFFLLLFLRIALVKERPHYRRLSRKKKASQVVL